MNADSSLVWDQPLRDKFLRLVGDCSSILHMQDHHIDVLFSETPNADESETIANVTCNDPYHSLHKITFFPPAIERAAMDDGGIDRLVLHEMVHLVTGPVKSLAHDVLVKEKFVTWREVKYRDEEVVDRLTNIIHELWRGRATEAEERGA